MTDRRRGGRGIARWLIALTALAPGVAAAPAAAMSDRDVLAAPVAPASQLDAVQTSTSQGVRFIRLQQEVGGHPVLGAQAVVADAPGARGDLLSDRTRARVATPADATLSRADAIDLARTAAGVQVPRADPQAGLVVIPRAGGSSRLAWRVVLPSRQPLATPEVLVEARTGDVLGQSDLLQHATGTARIFDPNPVAEQGSFSGLADNGDADSAALTALRVPVTLPRINESTTCLIGQWVRVTLPPNADVCAAGRDFTALTRSSDSFEAVMAYFHIDRAQAYVQSLGFTNVANRQIRVHADDFADDNSFFDPSTGEISLGTGGVDDGEDADVMVHEYGHALQDSQAPGYITSDQAGAISEGWADYFQAAVSATYSANHGFDACMAEWDAVTIAPAAKVPCGGLRQLEPPLKVSDLWTGTACDAEIHCAGQAWSGTLWDIRRVLGADADRIVFQSNYALPAGVSFEQGARALLAADRQLYAGSHRDLIAGAIAAHGLIDGQRIDDAPPDAAPLALGGSATGHFDIATDDHDVYAVSLAAGQSLIARVSAVTGDADLRVLRPGTLQVFDSGAALVSAQTTGASESLILKADTAGTYYLDVMARTGSGDYTVSALADSDADSLADGEDDCPAVANPGQENRDRDGLGDACDKFPDDAANDADGDGRGGNVDNCPAKANADQADWDRDGKGDLCDRSARVRVSRVTTRGGKITLAGDLRPLSLNPSAWRVRIMRKTCKAGKCRYRFLKEVRGSRRVKNGTVTATTRLKAGTYQIKPILRTKDYSAKAGSSRSLRVRR